MSRIGTTVRGIKIPIIKQGDDLVEILSDSLMCASKEEGISFKDKDVIAVTESVLARAQGNYATIDQISQHIKEHFEGKTVGLVAPILSRNRFGSILSGIAGGVGKLIIQLSYPSDEVGNRLVSIEQLDSHNIDPYIDVFTEEEFRKHFVDTKHQFTNVDYIEYYKSLGGKDCQIIFANNPKEILKHTPYVINADIHTRARTKKLLENAGAAKVISLDEILNRSVNGSGYHSQYGVLGSNLASRDIIKLFPRDAMEFCARLQKRLVEHTGKDIQCMIYGDGAFKDPIGGIWELADPVVSPGYTEGLSGKPNELKLKYLADNTVKDLQGDEAVEAVKKLIRDKTAITNENDFYSQGTTPRRLTDLIGSLCDLTTGSGDKGTPLVWIQGYFSNFSD